MRKRNMPTRDFILSRLPTPTRMWLRRLAHRARQVRRDVDQRVLDYFAPDAWVQSRNFRRVFGRDLNLDAPETFNEKLHWLMLKYRPSVVSDLACKYTARGYVARRVGAEVLNELYGVWDDPRAIPFPALPNEFVLKVTWSSGQNVFCRDKSQLDIDGTRRQLAKWMRRSGYWDGREWAYKKIKPRIIAERLLADGDGDVPVDYKFFCFGGKPTIIQVDTQRFTDHRRDLFDPEWQPLPVTLEYPSSGQTIPRPGTLPMMLTIAAALSRPFPFVRVDLYSIEGRAIFGEMTWYPGGGLERFDPGTYDADLGALLVLPGERLP